MKPHKPQNLTDKWKLDKLFDLLQVRGFVVFLNHCLQTLSSIILNVLFFHQFISAV